MSPRPSPVPRRPADGQGGLPSRPAEPVAARLSGLATGGSRRDDEEPSRLFLGFAYAFGLLAGVLLGIYGVVAVPAGPRPGGVLLSLGLPLAILGNTGVALLVRWLTGTRLGAMILLVGWVPVVLALGSSRPEGDLMLRSTATGYAFLALGALAPVVVAVSFTPRRGLTGIPRPPAPPSGRATGGR